MSTLQSVRSGATVALATAAVALGVSLASRLAEAQEIIFCVSTAGHVRIVEDETQCRASEVAQVLGDDAGAEPKVVFLSSSRHTGALGGVSGADDICQGLGDTIDNTRIYRALIASSAFDSDPYHRFTDQAGPYVLPNGELVANTFDQLVQAEFIRPINVDETGTTVVPVEAGDNTVWTNLSRPVYDFNETPPYSVRGSSDPNQVCSDYTASDKTGGYANINTIWSTWELFIGFQSCATEAHLYCVED
jgi:hypothetical protein